MNGKHLTKGSHYKVVSKCVSSICGIESQIKQRTSTLTLALLAEFYSKISKASYIS